MCFKIINFFGVQQKDAAGDKKTKEKIIKRATTVFVLAETNSVSLRGPQQPT